MAISEIGGAGAFRRNHGRAQGMLGRATRSESGTIDRFFQALKHPSADALGRFIDGDMIDLKPAVRVEHGVAFI